MFNYIKNKKVLVTGSAGFIGFHVSKQLLKNGFDVIGIDNLNSYYSVSLKHARLDNISNFINKKTGKWDFIKCDLLEEDLLKSIFINHKPEIVIHLAAQAGVRYSIENPKSYIDSNILGFINILENSKNKIKHFIYASSSSVYGGNKKLPFSENDAVNFPASLYAASKRSNELIAHTYSHLYNLPTTGLRFFTVYGPWGRPDMSYFIFTKSILENKPIKLFNEGLMMRDFTYIDDVVEGILALIDKPPLETVEDNFSNPIRSLNSLRYRILNLGNSSPTELKRFISIIEENLGVEAKKEFYPMQPGDVKNTYADINQLKKLIGYKPNTSLETGIPKFIDWYKKFYKI